MFAAMMYAIKWTLHYWISSGSYDTGSLTFWSVWKMSFPLKQYLPISLASLYRQHKFFCWGQKTRISVSKLILAFLPFHIGQGFEHPNCHSLKALINIKMCVQLVHFLTGAVPLESGKVSTNKLWLSLWIRLKIPIVSTC